MEDTSFVPYIHVTGERTVPSGITILGLSGGHARWTTIHIPRAILMLPVEVQLAAIPPLMRGYLKEYRGACPFFGMVTGFLYVRFQGCYRFHRDCEFIEYLEEPFRQRVAYCSLK
jgi:hypothetical protein